MNILHIVAWAILVLAGCVYIYISFRHLYYGGKFLLTSYGHRMMEAIQIGRASKNTVEKKFYLTPSPMPYWEAVIWTFVFGLWLIGTAAEFTQAKDAFGGMIAEDTSIEVLGWFSLQYSTIVASVLVVLTMGAAILFYEAVELTRILPDKFVRKLKQRNPKLTILIPFFGLLFVGLIQAGLFAYQTYAISDAGSEIESTFIDYVPSIARFLLALLSPFLLGILGYSIVPLSKISKLLGYLIALVMIFLWLFSLQSVRIFGMLLIIFWIYLFYFLAGLGSGLWALLGKEEEVFKPTSLELETDILRILKTPEHSFTGGGNGNTIHPTNATSNPQDIDYEETSKDEKPTAINADGSDPILTQNAKRAVIAFLGASTLTTVLLYYAAKPAL